MNRTVQSSLNTTHKFTFECCSNAFQSTQCAVAHCTVCSHTLLHQDGPQCHSSTVNIPCRSFSSRRSFHSRARLRLSQVLQRTEEHSLLSQGWQVPVQGPPATLCSNPCRLQHSLQQCKNCSSWLTGKIKKASVTISWNGAWTDNSLPSDPVDRPPFMCFW